MNRAILLATAAAVIAACDGRIVFDLPYAHDGGGDRGVVPPAGTGGGGGGASGGGGGGTSVVADAGDDGPPTGGAGGDAGDGTDERDAATVPDAAPDLISGGDAADARADSAVDRAADVVADVRPDTGAADTPPDTGGAGSGRCTAEAQCPSGLHCDTVARTCVVCTSETQCAGLAATPHCDTTRQRCVACTVATDCGTGRTCTRGRRCATTCIKNVQEACPAQASKCEDTSANGDLCSACDDDTTSGGCTGATPICYKDEGSCVGCLTGADCAGSGVNRFCDTLTNRCVGCLVTADCAAPTPFCHPGVGCVAGP